jgi:hypothetical protein
MTDANRKDPKSQHARGQRSGKVSRGRATDDGCRTYHFRGEMRFINILLGISKNTYGTKNIVKAEARSTHGTTDETTGLTYQYCTDYPTAAGP